MLNRVSNSKKTAVIGLIVASLMLVVSTAAYAQSPVIPAGTGTEADPYQISELGHLVWMGDNVTTSAYKYYTMTADIDASATATWNDPGTDTTILEGFKPIGTASYNPDTTSFRGIFDGNGHTITGLVVNRPSTYDIGLFGRVGTDGQVRNLGMVGGAFTGDYEVGSLVGANVRGTVSKCYATSTITGDSWCFNLGGLIGFNMGTVSDCYASGSVSGVRSTGEGLGGLIGANTGMVSRCYASGAVTGSQRIGGLVGLHASGGGSKLLDCYASGVVSGWDEVGGLVGELRDAAKVSNCYSTGAVNGSSNIGGLVGYGNALCVSKSYWDIQTSGQATSVGGTGKTTAEMKQQATFVDWNFATIWGIGENVTYPWLRALTVDSDGDGIPDPQDNCLMVANTGQEDGDGDRVGDACDACPDTLLGAVVDTQGCSAPIQADFDNDGDVDQEDFGHLQACLTALSDPVTDPACNNARLAGVNSIGQDDVAIFISCMSGPNVPADPNCSN